MSIGFVALDGGHWGFTTAVYLFFAALAGGAHVTGVAAYALGGDDERAVRLSLARWAFLVALVAVTIAGLAILSHLADPLAGLLFPVTLTNFGSWITIGTWVLVSLGAFTALQTLWVHFGPVGQDTDESRAALRWPARRLGLLERVDRFADRTRPDGVGYQLVTALGLLPAVGTVYTGFELAVVATVPLWNNPALLPALFLASGLAAGVAAALAPTIALEGAASRTAVGAAGVVAVGLLASVALLWGLWSSLGPSQAAEASRAMLADGSLAMLVRVLLASIVLSLVGSPLLAWIGYTRPESELTRRVVRPGLVGTLLAGVLGAFLVRYAVVAAGVQDPIVVVGI
jgi:protein NrfD